MPKKAIYTNSRYGLVLGCDRGEYRQENQDRLLITLLPAVQARPTLLLAAIADGMGGLQAGSQCAVLTLSSFIHTLYHSEKADLCSSISSAMYQANDAVFQQHQGQGGSTLTALIFDLQTEQAYCAHIGDCRLYGHKGRTIEQLTQDDCDPNGRLKQFVGIGRQFCPKIQTLNTSYSQYLLTSDGVHGMPEAALSRLIIEGRLQGSVIVERLLIVAPWYGGRDNASVALLQPKGWANLQQKKQILMFCPYTKSDKK